MATTPDIELQGQPLGRHRSRVQTTNLKRDEPEAAGYGDTSNQIWKLYGTESEKHDRALIDSWKSNANSVLIFTGLFSSIVASFLIETYKTLLPDSGSQTVSLLIQLVAQSNGTAAAASPGTSVQQSISSSAIRVNILLFLSLFFSVTSALVSTLIQQWAREYLQYSQPYAAPHKRGRVRAYLFDGLSQFQMKRLNYVVPVLLHLAVFLFFFAISEWLYPINVLVGATARYCLVTLLAVYIAFSILPLIFKNAPYHTALTAPLRASISLIYISFLALRRLVQRSSRVYKDHQDSGFFRSIHVDRARSLMGEIKWRPSKLDRSAMLWLLQELDEDNMDTFLGGLSGYIQSPLTDTKPVVEGLRKDGAPGRIREHFTTCVTSVELSEEQSMSRALSCINSLRLIFETSDNDSIKRHGSENDDIQAIMEHLEPLCYISNPKTALRASCIRSLVILQFLFPLASSDAEQTQTKKFPDYLIPLCRAIRIWKTTKITQWSHRIGTSPVTGDPLPSDKEMWADVLFDGPLINLAVLAYAVLSRADEEEVNLGEAWKILGTLLKSIGPTQVRASVPVRARLDEVLLLARGVGRREGGGAQTMPLIDTLDTVISGIYLAKVFTYLPNSRPPQRRIEAIFGKAQLRDSELLEAFAAHLPQFIDASAPETSRDFLEHLILENKLWEQLRDSLSKCFDPLVPFLDKVQIATAIIDISVVAFKVLADSSKIDWQYPDFDILVGRLGEFVIGVTPSMATEPVANLHAANMSAQFYHVLMMKFFMQSSRNVPDIMHSLNDLTGLVTGLELASKKDMAYLMTQSAGKNPNLMTLVKEILSVTLRDGPLSNFCRLVRLSFKATISEASEFSSVDMNGPVTILRRMLDTPDLPLANASGGIWAEFKDIRTMICRTFAITSNRQNAVKLLPLLEMLKNINHMRSAADEHAEETGNQTRSISSILKGLRHVSFSVPSSRSETESPVLPSPPLSPVLDASPPRGGAYTDPWGGSYATPPGGGSYATPPGGGSYATPPGGGSYATPPGGGSYATPPGGGSYATPPWGGSYATPPGGGSYVTPPWGGSYATPPGGGSYATPPGGRSYVTPPGGRAYSPIAWIPYTEAYPGAMYPTRPPTPPIPTMSPGPGTPYPYPPYAPFIDTGPYSTVPPHIPGVRDVRRHSSLDSANSPADIQGRSMPIPPGYMAPRPSPPIPRPKRPNPYSLEPMNEGNPSPVREPGVVPSPDHNYKGDGSKSEEEWALRVTEVDPPITSDAHDPLRQHESALGLSFNGDA